MNTMKPTNKKKQAYKNAMRLLHGNLKTYKYRYWVKQMVKWGKIERERNNTPPTQ